MTSLTQALSVAGARGLERLETQMLLLHALGRSPRERAWLIAHGDEPLPPAASARFEALCERRLAGEPVAYLIGQKEFQGLTLQVDRRALDPRPDTETLVDWALQLLPVDAPFDVLDLGTGSGAIALAIAHARPRARVVAVDASADALALARANAERLGLPIDLRLGDWLAPVAGEQFDVIVSNPPYIAAADPHLPALAHEPRQALVSGADGLDDIRRIVAAAPAHLRPGGWLLLEHGWDQATAVRILLAQAGFSARQSRRDLARLERCTGGRLGAASNRPGAESPAPRPPT